jgi:hypothetical protein
MLDDRGQSVKVLNPVAFNPWPVQGDDRIAALIRRVGLALQGKSVFRRIAWQVLMVIGAIAVAIVVVTVCRRYLPGVPGWVPVLVVVFGSSAGGARLVRFMACSTESDVAAIVLEEGLCPVCGYNFYGLSADTDDCVVCPECAAAWKWDRIARLAPFQAGAREGDAIATLRTGVSVASSWTTTDDRGRRVELAHPRLRLTLKAAADGAEREAIGACRDQIRRSARWVRWPVLTVIWSMGVAAIAYAVVELGFTVIAIVLLGFAFAATFGNFCYSSTMVRRTLLASKRCPSCASSTVGIEPEEDGCLVCRRCLSAWRAETQEPLSTSSLS